MKPTAWLSGLLLLCVAGATIASSLTAIDHPGSAPSIRLSDRAGADFDLGDHAGRVIMVNFWATWCPPCLEEMPSMQELHGLLEGRDFTMVAVNVGEDAEDVNRFVAAFDSPLDFHLLVDPDLRVVKSWPVFGLPSTFIIDRAGMLRYKAVGERNWSAPEIVELLENLLEE